MGSSSSPIGVLWVFVGVALSGTALGCTVAVGAGVGAAMLTTAALTAGCDEPIDVTVFDGVTGLPACDAQVVARRSDGAQAKFASCFHAELSAGNWTIHATRLGYQPASAPLVISKARRCDPAVQTMEISMLPQGQAPSAPMAIRPLRPGEAPLTPGALPAPTSIGVEQAAPPPAPPPSSSTAPSAAPPAPATPVAPPTTAPPAAVPSASAPSTGAAPASGQFPLVPPAPPTGSSNPPAH